VSHPSDLALGWLWLEGRLRTLLRNPRGTFFTLVFPLILLVLFNGLNNSNVGITGGEVAFSQFFTPSVAVFAMTTATFTSVIFGLATAREQGILKRVRGTPLPMSVFISSWLVAAVITGFVSVVVMFAVAVPAFGVDIRAELLPAAVVTLVLGGAAMSAIGLGVASFIRRVETAPIVANVTLFPLLFVSGVFYPIESEPHWLQTIADLFPLSHFVRAFDACFSPFTTGSGFAFQDLAVLAAWGIAGAVVAARRLATEAEDGEEAPRRRWLRLAV
jgi:ABC-2 type transport system permease protein